MPVTEMLAKLVLAVTRILRQNQSPDAENKIRWVSPYQGAAGIPPIVELLQKAVTDGEATLPESMESFNFPSICKMAEAEGRIFQVYVEKKGYKLGHPEYFGDRRQKIPAIKMSAGDVLKTLEDKQDK